LLPPGINRGERTRPPAQRLAAGPVRPRSSDLGDRRKPAGSRSIAPDPTALDRAPSKLPSRHLSAPAARSSAFLWSTPYGRSARARRRTSAWITASLCRLDRQRPPLTRARPNLDSVMWISRFGVDAITLLRSHGHRNKISRAAPRAKGTGLAADGSRCGRVPGHTTRTPLYINGR